MAAYADLTKVLFGNLAPHEKGFSRSSPHSGQSIVYIYMVMHRLGGRCTGLATKAPFPFSGPLKSALRVGAATKTVSWGLCGPARRQDVNMRIMHHSSDV